MLHTGQGGDYMPNSAKYQEKMKRINDAISLTEGDVPMIPIVQCYPYIHAGYTMADILYDVINNIK